MPSNQATPGDARRAALHLIPAEHQRAPRPEPRTPTASPEDPAELAELREQLADTHAQLTQAMEEVAFLTEQIRCEEAFRDHLLQLERARHRASRDMFARDLAVIQSGLMRDDHVLDATAADGTDGLDGSLGEPSSDHAESD